MSPTIYTIGACMKVKIHAKDHNPPHVHVEGKGCEARFTLKPLALLTNTGFSRSDIQRIEAFLRERLDYLQEVWDENQS